MSIPNHFRAILATLLLLVVAAPSAHSQSEAAPPQVPIYVFWGDGCQHCAAQKPFLAELEAAYPQVQVRAFEVWYQVENRRLFQAMAARAGVAARSVPTTFIGDRVWVGFHESMKRDMEMAVIECIRSSCMDRGSGIVPAPGSAVGLSGTSAPALPAEPPRSVMALPQSAEADTPSAQPAPAAAPEPESDRAWPEATDALPAAPSDAGAGASGDATSALGDVIHIPVLGAVNLGARSLPVSTALIAFVDGFNPCSLWVLSILLALVLHTGSRRKIAVVGSTFLVVTAAVYGLFILGLFKIFMIVDFLGIVQVVVALLALGFALVNIKDYFWYKQGLSFTISDRYKPKIYRDIRNLATPGRSTAALLGATVVMALGIALIELPCTAGFPVLWSSIVAGQGVSTGEFAGLLGLYMLVYLMDELVIFGTAVYTLRMSRMQETHGRALKLVGGMVMLALALTLLLDPGRMNSIGGSLAVFGAAFGATLLILVVHRWALPALGLVSGGRARPET
jgi:glutaredoxin